MSVKKVAGIISNTDLFTKLLLHFDGADASTTFTDSSGQGKTVTAVGNAQIDTAQSKFNGASGLFDGTGDWLTVPDSDDWNFDMGNFCIDFWVRFNSVATSQALFAQRTNDSNRVLLYWDQGANELSFYAFNGGATIANMLRSWTPSANTWYHVALIRNEGIAQMYINGSKIGTDFTLTGRMPDVGAVISIGGRSSEGDLGLNGWLDEFRISKGKSRYTANFTAPTAPYPNINQLKKIVGVSNTPNELITHALYSDANLRLYCRFENNVNDSSPSGYNLTASGSPTYTTGRFGQAIDLEASSSQFAYIINGSSANLNTTGSRSISLSVKLESTPDGAYIINKDGGTSGWLLYLGGGVRPGFYIRGLTPSGLENTPTLSTGVWHHIICVYDAAGSKIKVFVDGVKTEVTVTSGTSTSNTKDTTVGAAAGTNGAGTSSYFDGLMEDLAFWDRALTDAEAASLSLYCLTKMKKIAGVTNV